MFHKEHGVCAVSFEDGSPYVNVGGSWHRSKPEDLLCYWPDARAVNLFSRRRAGYLGRKSKREAKRSCTQSHYYWQWGDLGSSDVTKAILMGSDFPTYPTALEAMEQLEDGWSSVAISRNIILDKGTTGYRSISVIYRGQEVGELRKEQGGFRYVPSDKFNPLSKRAAIKLEKEGITCP